jgi:hypothetical protein
MRKTARFALAALVLMAAPACADSGTPLTPKHAEAPATRQMLDAISVTITGTTSILSEGEYEWTANASGGSNYSYTWYVLDKSTFNWIYLTNGPTFADGIGPGRGPEWQTIRVDVTAGSDSASDTHDYYIWTP